MFGECIHFQQSLLNDLSLATTAREERGHVFNGIKDAKLQTRKTISATNSRKLISNKGQSCKIYSTHKESVHRRFLLKVSLHKINMHLLGIPLLFIIKYLVEVELFNSSPILMKKGFH